MSTWVMGDPQAPFETVMAVLRNHGALDGDRLKDDARLISVGDHFDYDFGNPDVSAREGLRVLRWLASQPHATLLLGNHDVSRVMEFATITDAEFSAAQVLARTILELRKTDRAEADRLTAEFTTRFPTIPTVGLAARDYAAFTTEQRALVVELLLAGRFQLAATGTLPDGRRALITHAGIAQRELDLLGMPDERDADVIAAALQATLHAAIEQCRPSWERGEIVPLSLEPLHLPGQPGVGEGGGLLYHRPSCPDRAGADRAWELAPTRPRRFSPRELPLGLTQICGHTGHTKCLSELGTEWPTQRARENPRGGIRTLRRGANVSYDMGVADAASDTADLILVDGEMYRVEPASYQLLRLA